jgi:hypothetical protein
LHVKQKNNEKTRVRLRMSKKSCTFAAGFRIEKETNPTQTLPTGGERTATSENWKLGILSPKGTII